MTPEERHALAERLDADAEWHTGECAQKHANYGGARGCCADANAAHDLRAAAAALREMPSTEEVVTAARASLWEQMESEAVERLTAEVARLREGIESALAEVVDHSPLSFGKDPVGCTTCYPHDASWPCGAREAADSLSALLEGGTDG